MNTETKIRARVSAREFLRVSHFKADHDIRYYLCGVTIERAASGGVYVLATDGSTAGISHDPDGMIEGADSVIVPATKQLLAACKMKPKGFKDSEAQVVLNGKRLSVAAGFDCESDKGELHVHAGPGIIEAKPIDWRRVLPDFGALKPGVFSRFNEGLLSRFALADVGGFRRIKMARVWQKDEHSVIAVQLVHVPQFLGLLMPQRDGVPEDWNMMERYVAEREAVKPKTTAPAA